LYLRSTAYFDGINRMDWIGKAKKHRLLFFHFRDLTHCPWVLVYESDSTKNY
jgi:hypothetical protein